MAVNAGSGGRPEIANLQASELREDDTGVSETEMDTLDSPSSSAVVRTQDNKVLRVLLVGGGSPLGLNIIQRLSKQRALIFHVTMKNSPPLQLSDVELAGNIIIKSLQFAHWRKAIRRAEKSMGGIDFLFYLDSFYHQEKFGDTDISQARRLMDFNCIGPMHAIQAALPSLRKSSGQIAVLAHSPDEPGDRETALYTASKRALATYVNSLRKRESKITFTCIYPGELVEPPMPPARKPSKRSAAEYKKAVDSVSISDQFTNELMEAVLYREESCMASKRERPSSMIHSDCAQVRVVNSQSGAMEDPPAVPKLPQPSTPDLITAMLTNDKSQFKLLLKGKERLHDIITQPDDDGRCAIHYCAHLGQLDAMAVLLKKNRRELLKLTDHYGWTALHFAADAGHLRMTKRLLQESADPNALTNSGMSCLHFLARLRPGDDPKVIARYQLTLMKLLDLGADVNQRNVNWVTPLHEAAANRSPIAVDLFLQNEGDPHRKTRITNETPLQYAMKPKNRPVIKLLLDAGADPVGCFDIAPVDLLPGLEEYRERNRRPDPDFEITAREPIFVSCIDDLPEDAKNLFQQAQLESDLEEIDEHWDEFLMSLRFVTRKRLKSGRDLKKERVKSVPNALDTPDASESKGGDALLEIIYNDMEKAEKKREESGSGELRRTGRKSVQFNTRAGHDMTLDEAYEKLISAGNPLKLFRVEKTQVGRGGFGTVFRGRRIGTREDVAIKKVSHLTEKEQWSNLDEIYFLSTLVHECIVPYNSSYRYRDEIWIVMDYLAGGCLNEVCNEDRLEEKHICYLTYRMLKGLAFIHEHNFVHRDLKSSNIMLDISGGVYIIDFGLCARSPVARKAMVGSPFWMPPEMMTGGHHTTASDIWSLGILCLEMTNGKPPHNHSALKAMYKTAIGDIPTFQHPKSWSPEFHAFIKRLLVTEPTQRATAAELLEDNWFDSMASRKDMQGLLQHIFVQKSLETLLV